MINENVMAQGSFEVPLKATVPYSLWKKMELFGHIVVFPQNIDPYAVGNTAALNAARYAGPLLEKDTSGEGLQLRGAGMTWWLGDDLGNGPLITNTFSDESLTTIVAAILPDSLTSGTVSNTGLGTFSGDFHYEIALEVLRSVCLAVGAEFRVNPNGSVDAGLKTSVYTITSPEVVVVRRGYGSDSTYTGVPVEQMRTWLNGREYVTDVEAVVTKSSDGSKTLIDASTRSDSHLDIFGNAFSRSRLVTLTQSNPINMATHTLGVLNASAIEQNQEISTEHYEIHGGTISVGDAVWAFDPPAFTDSNNQITFRGDVINPANIRLIAASWPLRRGMGVWYRSSLGVDEPWIDLTRYVAWEGEEGEFT